jgi:hypothetical protein
MHVVFMDTRERIRSGEGRLCPISENLSGGGNPYPYLANPQWRRALVSMAGGGLDGGIHSDPPLQARR